MNQNYAELLTLIGKTVALKDEFSITETAIAHG
jgi:hypothetical protein